MRGSLEAAWRALREGIWATQGTAPGGTELEDNNLAPKRGEVRPGGRWGLEELGEGQGSGAGEFALRG